nr:hypothetical protein BaRGS_024623 [Batillaria attramentaria]
MLGITESMGTGMAGDGVNDKLRDKIKAKRAHDGLDEIPDDLFAKKPRSELTEEERQRLFERRQRNKEAAEKSRKKKKEEFEKLQQENDQLLQDKCELAAMITKQKQDIDTITLDNVKLRSKLDTLLRWIASRSKEFGLEKHRTKEREQEKVLNEHDSSDPIMRGDPTLQLSFSQKAPVPLIAATPAKQPPAREEASKMMGISPRPLQTPWLVEQTTQEVGKKSAGEEDDVMIIDDEQVVHVEIPAQVTEEQQILYLPKDTVLIVQNESGDQITAVTAPEPEVHVTQPAAGDNQAGMSESITSAMAVLNGEGNDDLSEAAKTTVAQVKSPAAAAAAAEESVTPAAAVASSTLASSVEEIVVSTTTTTTTGSEHVSREALMSFVEALVKLGVKFDTNTLPGMITKASDTISGPIKSSVATKRGEDEKLSKAKHDHNYLPATPAPRKNGNSMLLAH